MLEASVCPFRSAMVIACGSPGVLVEVDVALKGDDKRALLRNTWGQQPDAFKSKRPRRAKAPYALQRRRRSANPDDEIWMTGITVGPSAWDNLRAGAMPPPIAEPSLAGLRTPSAPGAAAAAATPLGRRPTGPTLYASRYELPGIVAFDATTLLPLGAFIVFESEDLQDPEGICATDDALYVVCATNCVVARVGIQPLPPAPRRPRTRAAAATAAAGSSPSPPAPPAPPASPNPGSQRQGSQRLRPGGHRVMEPTPFGAGVVLFTVTAGLGWVGWGLALSPDASCLFCAVDRSYATHGKVYSRARPPRTSGDVLCVPLECLGVAPALPAPPAAQQQPGGSDWGTGSGGAAAGIAAPGPREPYLFTRGLPVLRRPSGLRFSPDGGSLWVTSFDAGLAEIAGPAAGEKAGTVLRVVKPPPQPPQRAGRPSGSNPLPMLPWDVCFVPTGPPPLESLRSLAAGGAGGPCASPGAQGSQGPRTPVRTPPSRWQQQEHQRRQQQQQQQPVLCCVTLHEDWTRSLDNPSGAECRVGVLEAVSGEGDGGQAGEGEERRRAAEVRISATWRACRQHAHPSTACVC